MDRPEESQTNRQGVTQLVKEIEPAKKTAHVTQVFLKNITDYLPQYVFWKDINSVYLGCNKNFATLVGLSSPEDIINKTDYDLPWKTPGCTAEFFQDGDRKTISGQPPINQEEFVALPDGKLLTLLVSKLPIIDKGKVIGIAGYFSDITELKDMQKKLLQESQAREDCFKAMSSIGGIMAHELNSSLMSIKLNAQIIEERLSPLIEAYRDHTKFSDTKKIRKEHLDDLIKDASDIRESARYASDTISTILSVFHYSTSEGTSVEEIEINETVQQALKTYSLNEEQRALIHLDLSNTHKVLGSAKIILHVIHNLLKNALYAIRVAKKGSITISTKKRKNSVQLIFKDTATGISKEIQKHIFEPFYTIKDCKTNIGLGLYFCKVALAKMNASIICDTQEGQHTTFIIEFKSLLKNSKNKRATY